jgi:hypothetical protein
VTCGGAGVELRGFEPLTSCMPCHPHHFTRSSAALVRTVSAPLRDVAGRRAAVRREAARGIAADNLLTVPRARPAGNRPRATSGRGVPGLDVRSAG